MGKPKKKGLTGRGDDGDPSEEEQAVEDKRVKEEGNTGSIEEGESAPPPPPPRKRGRPRKVVAKVEEDSQGPVQKIPLPDNVESKKQKSEGHGRNGSASEPKPGRPHQRTGSRRKSEPRRAAD